ncbi:CDP-alcohol phosphatidyltransferase family protein [Halorubrum vacuolatum]|uniref:CDP-diacylglycerol--glycerol-3-phosphate 3-phosphatidyltransferase n=1 Tax=Halorubrum vacuolatum TaxID=63740 RepID=A0A238WYF8_HALVU|nr:CDP-alcohol phosphatidyltransferase family protein [Halorubrum vacuolatum]SNR51458.1 CDP-diacylglycerol--glycerol-3-phosphate 3-phosphatidyltransferase [Halorubrum vacuolatum]
MTATVGAAGRTPPWRPYALVTLCGLLVVSGTVGLLATMETVAITGWVGGGVAGSFAALTVVIGWVMASTTPRAGERRITAATWITLCRGWALVVFTGVVALAPTATRIGWIALGLFLAAITLDAVDGAVARRTETETALGARLDTEVDALIVLVGTVATVALGLVPAVFLLVGLARYGFVGGVALRRRRGLPVYDLEASRYRKVTGALIMGTIALGLLPTVDPAVSRAVGWLVTGPILAHFVWDYFGVSGRRGRRGRTVRDGGWTVHDGERSGAGEPKGDR